MGWPRKSWTTDPQTSAWNRSVPRYSPRAMARSWRTLIAPLMVECPFCPTIRSPFTTASVFTRAPPPLRGAQPGTDSGSARALGVFLGDEGVALLDHEAEGLQRVQEG